MSEDLSVLLPVDITESTNALLSIGEELARIGVHEIRLLHVVNSVDAVSDPDLLGERQSILKRYRVQLKGYGIQKVTGEVVVGIPWVEIIRRTQKKACSMVVMGSHGKGILERVFLGSQTENVLHHGNDPLIVVRLDSGNLRSTDSWHVSPDRLFQRILYATDFSEGARRCIPFLEKISSAEPVMLGIVHVQDIRHVGYASDKQLTSLEREEQRELIALCNHFRSVGYSMIETKFTRGNAISEILRIIREDTPTILVVGAKGSYGIIERALGGVSDTMVHLAPIHVAIIR